MKPAKWEIFVVLILAAVLALWAFWPKEEGNRVTVTVDGTVFGTFPLTEPQEIAIDGFAPFSLTLVIEDGQAHVEHSTCPDLICQHHAPISRTGAEIVCLPGRVVITVTGEETEVDAITQ